MDRLLTAQQAARILGVSARRVRALLQEGVIPSQKLGKAYAVHPRDLIGITVYYEPGRPSRGDGHKVSWQDIQRQIIRMIRDGYLEV